MASENRTTLKTYFETGDRPTQEQFATLIDSCVNNIDDAIPMVYVCTLTPDNLLPSDKVLANTLGETLTWVRESEGVYYVQSDLFAGNIWIGGFSAFNQHQGSVYIAISGHGGGINGYFTIYKVNATRRVYMECVTSDLITPKDLSALIDTDIFYFPEIRIYP